MVEYLVPKGLLSLRYAGWQAFLLSALFICAPTSMAMDNLATVDDLLRQMSQALQERSYRGRFTYEYGGALDTLEIVHAVRDGVEYERLQHLSGPSREVVRTGRATSCINTGGLLLRGGTVSQLGAETRGAGTEVSLNQHYHFYLRGEERVAGRRASLIQITPKDDARYGMTLAVDQASGLLLMWLTASAQQKVLERLQFVALEVDPVISESELSALSPQHLRFGPESAPCVKTAALAPPRWLLSWLPAGFILSQVEHPAPDQEFLTFTDGLASFTVFIKPIEKIDGARSGLAMRGAT